MSRLLLIATLPILTSLVACGGTSDPGTGTPSTFTQVKNDVFVPSCNFSSCHAAAGAAGSGNLDLATNPYAALVNVAAVQAGAKADGLMRVVANNSAKSFLYLKLTFPTASDAKYGTRMPETGQTVSATQLAEVLGWINAGAPNN
jgi:hypothetical protein